MTLSRFKFCWALLMIVVPGMVQAASQPKHRTDLEVALSKSMCAQNEQKPAAAVKGIRPLSPLQLWQAGIYDTQMEVTWITSDAAIDLRELAQAALEQARRLTLGGYAYGLCSGQRAWMIASPAPEALLHLSDGFIRLRTQGLAASCATFDLDAASATTADIKTVLKKHSPQKGVLQVNPSYLGKSTLSVTCQPHQASKRGPELWALMPVGTWDFSSIPHFDSSSHNSLSGLRLWMQKLRHSQQLQALQVDQPLLARFAKELLGHHSIRHPRPLLRSQAAQLKKQKGQYLGENRVKGFSPSDMAWLLWYSPRHRRLVLHKDANAVGLQISQKTREKLLVMVLAKI